MKNNHFVYVLIVVWWTGAAMAGVAVLLPEYSIYLLVGSVGWITVAASSGLIIYEIKRMKKEDNKKSNELADRT